MKKDYYFDLLVHIILINNKNNLKCGILIQFIINAK